jgi:hypothetical protein
MPRDRRSTSRSATEGGVVDRYDGPETNIVVVAEDDLFVPEFMAGVEEFHGVASLILFFGNTGSGTA